MAFESFPQVFLGLLRETQIQTSEANWSTRGSLTIVHTHATSARSPLVWSLRFLAVYLKGMHSFHGFCIHIRRVAHRRAGQLLRLSRQHSFRWIRYLYCVNTKWSYYQNHSEILSHSTAKDTGFVCSTPPGRGQSESGPWTYLFPNLGPLNFICVYVCVYVYLYIHTYIHVYVYIRTYTYTYI